MAAFVRVDPASEQAFEALVDAWLPETTFDERVETEARQMADVEHDRMTLRDRLRVERVRVQHLEEGAGSRAIACVPIERVLTIDAASRRLASGVGCGRGQRLRNRLHVTTLSWMPGAPDANVPSHWSLLRARRRGGGPGRCRRHNHAPANVVTARPVRPRRKTPGHGSHGRS